MKSGLGVANLALAFAIELAMLAAFAWAALRIEGWAGWAAAAAALIAAIALWAVLAAPKSPRRLRQPWLLVFKAAMFGAAALALAAAGATAWAAGLAAISALHLALGQALRQQ